MRISFFLRKLTIKHFPRLTAIAAIFAMLGALLPLRLPGPIPIVQAGAATSVRDTVTRTAVSASSNHTIQFVLTAGTTVTAGETITVTFPSGFASGLNGVAEAAGASDFDLAEDTDASPGSCTGTLTDETLDATATTTTWGVAVSVRTITFTAPSNAATYIAASACVIIEIGTNATNEFTGVNQIVNPSSAASNLITIGGTFGDTGSLAITIVLAANEQVTVSATVDPAITFTISTNALTLSPNPITTAAVSCGSYTITTTTNSIGGYSTTIVENNNFRIDASNDIDDVGDGEVTLGVEEYGGSTSEAGQAITQDTTACTGTNPASALTGTAQTVANATIAGAETTTIAHKAAITATTTAGSYSHIVTLVSTGTF